MPHVLLDPGLSNPRSICYHLVDGVINMKKFQYHGITVEDAVVAGLNLWKAFIDYWYLQYATICPHELSRPALWDPDDIEMRQGAGQNHLRIVDSLANGCHHAGYLPSNDFIISLTATSRMVQYLGCSFLVRNLYQGGCCLGCALRQAKDRRIAHTICGCPWEISRIVVKSECCRDNDACGLQAAGPLDRAEPVESR